MVITSDMAYIIYGAPVQASKPEETAKNEENKARKKDTRKEGV